MFRKCIFSIAEEFQITEIVAKKKKKKETHNDSLMLHSEVLAENDCKYELLRKAQRSRNLV